jgi:YD repeat-containing protein
MSSQHAWATVSRLVIGAALSGGLILLAATAEAGILDATWTAPTTNIDGGPLTDLSSYRVYYGSSSSPCPGSTSVAVASPTSSPGANQQVSVRLSGLATGATYHVSVTAVDTAGNQSDCSGVASATARADFSVSPSGTMSFGSVNLGSSADRTFTVSNTGGGVLSGSVSLGAPAGSGANPFTIVSGNPINLSGASTTQNVTVRFTPSTTTTVSTNLIFAVGGGTVSAIMTGTGTGTDTTRPTVTITWPTSGDIYSTSATSLSLAGTANDDIGVTQVSWANSRGGSGTATGTTSWSAGIPLQSGSNVITLTARDAVGNSGTDTLTVTVNDAAAPSITITSPTINPTFSTSGSSLSLAGTASDNVGVTQVSWTNNRGGTGTATGTTSWSAGIPLQSGSNVITVTARDAAGNSANDALTVTVSDTAVPSITITSPTVNPTFSASGSASSSLLSLAGTASDNVGVTQVSWTNNRGGTGTASGTTSWSAAGIPLQTGSNVITVTARDAAGNSAVDMLTVTYNTVVADTTPPSVTIAPPAATAVATASTSTLTLQGTASDDVGVTQVSWSSNRGGSGMATGTTSWSASGITLQLGANVITVTARDAAGNLGSALMTLTQDDTISPSVAVTAPTVGASVTGTVTVSASAADNVGVAGVRFKIDGVDLGAEVNRAPYAVTWNTTTVTNGPHVVTAVAWDAAGNVTSSNNITVSVANTAPDVDERAPRIWGVMVSDVTTTGARIVWTTDEPSNSRVEYGRKFYRNRTPLDQTMVTSHSQLLSGLAPYTWYHFRVRSRDAAGNLGVSQEFWFRTDGRYGR